MESEREASVRGLRFRFNVKAAKGMYPIPQKEPRLSGARLPNQPMKDFEGLLGLFWPYWERTPPWPRFGRWDA